MHPLGLELVTTPSTPVLWGEEMSFELEPIGLLLELTINHQKYPKHKSTLHYVEL